MASPTPAHEPAPAPRATRNDIRCGEKVAFEGKHLNTVVGAIVRINQRTATIDTGDGMPWRVGFALGATSSTSDGTGCQDDFRATHTPYEPRHPQFCFLTARQGV